MIFFFPPQAELLAQIRFLWSPHRQLSFQFVNQTVPEESTDRAVEF